MKGKGPRVLRGRGGCHKKYIKNIMAPRREETTPLTTLWGFSGEQGVNLRGPIEICKVLTEKAHHASDAWAKPDPRKQGSG